MEQKQKYKKHTYADRLQYIHLIEKGVSLPKLALHCYKITYWISIQSFQIVS